MGAARQSGWAAAALLALGAVACVTPYTEEQLHTKLEVAAKAVVYAADHPKRREYWVGGSTVGTLLANAVAPGLLDRYLARTGFSSQQTDQPRNPDQPKNLWEPADEHRDFGAHGKFDDRSTGRSFQLWASHHHGAVLAAAGAAVGGLVAATRAARR